MTLLNLVFGLDDRLFIFPAAVWAGYQSPQWANTITSSAHHQRRVHSPDITSKWAARAAGVRAAGGEDR